MTRALRRGLALTLAALLAFTTPLSAQCPNVNLPATGGGYYLVMVNGVQVSQHTTERAAAARGVTEKLRNPAATVSYSLTSVTRVEACLPASGTTTDTVVVTRVDTLTLPPIIRVDTLVVVRVDTVFVTPPSDTVVTPPPPPVDTIVTPPPPPPVVTPPPATALGPHPRVWMTPARIAHVQSQVAANTSRWRAVKNMADISVAKGSGYATNDEAVVPDLCLAYLGTGNVSYAQRAGAVLTGYFASGQDPFKSQGYDVRYAMPVVTQGLDWCYNGLTVAQRQAAATWLMTLSDRVWPQSSGLTHYATDNVPANNFWWGFMMTGPAALAAGGDDTGTGTLSGSNRPLFHQTLALDKWANVAMPFFAGPGKGGAWSDGTNYESTWPVGRFVDAFATNGIALDTSFLAASLRWRIAGTMPGDVYKVVFGDQPRVATAPLYSYDRMAALYALAVVPSMKPAIQTWLDAIGQVPTFEFNYTSMVADELLRYDPAQPTAPITLARDFWAPGPGFFIYRQSWTDPMSTVFTWQAGPQSEHGTRSANGLMIWKGAFWISASANLYAYGGISYNTTFYNNMTVGPADGAYDERRGPGQFFAPSNSATMDVPAVSDTLVVLRGQAKNAYGYVTSYWNTRFVDDDQRTVAYLPVEDAFVVVGRVTITDASKSKIFRWHSERVPTIAGNTFTLTSPSGDARCAGTVLSPGDVTLGLQVFALSRTPGQVTSNAVTVTTPARATDLVVTVLQCAAGTPLTPTATIGATDIAVVLGSRHITLMR